MDTNKLVSKCCGAKIQVFEETDHAGRTSDWYQCHKCGKPCVPVESEPKEELCKCGHEKGYHLDYSGSCTVPDLSYRGRFETCSCCKFAPVEQPIKQENPYKNTEAESYWEDGYEAGKKAKAPSLEDLVEIMQECWRDDSYSFRKAATAILKLWNEEK